MDLQDIRRRVPFDLTQFEKLYDVFDKGHDRKHMESVRDRAVALATKYAPDQTVRAYIAATLHDIGLSVGRGDHEKQGVQIILKDEEINKRLPKESVKAIADAVREHRASTGKPKTILARIISDADRTSCNSPSEGLARSYEYGKIHYPKLSDEEQLIRAATHLKKKYGESGYGTGYFFPESEEHQKRVYASIIKALESGDIQKLQTILAGKIDDSASGN